MITVRLIQVSLWIYKSYSIRRDYRCAFTMFPITFIVELQHILSLAWLYYFGCYDHQFYLVKNIKICNSKHFGIRNSILSCKDKHIIRNNFMAFSHYVPHKHVYDPCDNQTSEKGSPCGKISRADVTYEIVKLAEALKLFGRNLLRLPRTFSVNALDINTIPCGLQSDVGNHLAPRP